MASSLFNNQQQQTPQGISPQMISDFKNFANSLNGKDPKQMVMNLLSSGKMTNPQFQQLMQQAKMLQGILKL